MANRIHDAFDSVKAQPQLVESTKQFLAEKYKKETRPVRSRAFRRSLIAFCCMAFVLAAGAWGYSWLQMPVSYVSIDVNPSIELALNRFDYVVSTDAYNAEGAEILNSLPLKGKKYTDAIELIVGSEEMGAYLTDESELVFTVAADDSREGEIKSGVENCACYTEYKSQSVSADMAIVSQAHGHGVSLGKYYAYLQLAQYDNTVTVEGCRDMSVSEMHSMAKEHKHGKDGEHSQDAEQEYLNDSDVDESDVNESDVDESDVDESDVNDSDMETHHSGHHHEKGHE